MRDGVAAVDDRLQEHAGIGVAALGDFDADGLDLRPDSGACGIADRGLPDPPLARGHGVYGLRQAGHELVDLAGTPDHVVGWDRTTDRKDVTNLWMFIERDYTLE